MDKEKSTISEGLDLFNRRAQLTGGNLQRPKKSFDFI
jgi:hypothetical protein